jgi:hypothetical protein
MSLWMFCVAACTKLPQQSPTAHLLQAALGGTIRSKAWCGVAVSASTIHVEHMATCWLLLHAVDGLTQAAG